MSESAEWCSQSVGRRRNRHVFHPHLHQAPITFGVLSRRHDPLIGPDDSLRLDGKLSVVEEPLWWGERVRTLALGTAAAAATVERPLMLAIVGVERRQHKQRTGGRGDPCHARLRFEELAAGKEVLTSPLRIGLQK